MKITEVSPQKNNPNRVSVYSDGEYVFSLDAVDAVVLGIKAGREISEKELNNLLFESRFGKAKAKALDILSRKNVTSRMLTNELSSKGYDEAVVCEVINELESLGYIDDYSFAVMYMEQAIEKLWGKKKIVYELTQKGVDINVIEDALEEIELPGAEELVECIARKYGGEDIEDYKTKQRITRFFASRGFDFSVINDAINLYIKKD